MAHKMSMDRLILEARDSVNRLSELLNTSCKLEKVKNNLISSKLIAQAAVDIKQEFDSSYFATILDDDNIEGLQEIRSTRLEIDKILLSINIGHAQFESTFDQVELETLQNANNKPPSPTGISNLSNIRLPRVSVGKFSGKLSDWNSYISMYNNLVYNNSNLQPIEKYFFLLDSLDTNSKNLIRHLPVTNEHFETAYDILIKRYECRRLLVNTHFSALEDVPKAKSNSHFDLRELINCFVENLAGLRQMKVDLLEVFLFQMFSKKLDTDLLKTFELENKQEIPTFEQLKGFVEKHCKALEISHMVLSDKQNKNVVTYVKQPNRGIGFDKHSQFAKAQSRTALVTTSVIKKCLLCEANHGLLQCSKFLDHSPQDRYKVVKEKQLCINCLLETHRASDCKSNATCKKCSKPHHTLLHFGRPTIAKEENIVLSSHPSTSGGSSLFSSRTSSSVTLLATVQVCVRDGFGKVQVVRALLDNGSMESFMSEQCRQRLGLNKRKVSVKVEGLGLSSSHVSGALSCKIHSREQTTPQLDVDVFIIPEICGKLPAAPLKINEWSHTVGLTLADPDFHKPGKIDMLLGANVFAHIVQNESRRGSNGEPVAFKTLFGWILTGKLVSPGTPCTSLCAVVEPVDFDLRMFWELENIPNSSKLIPTEEAAERHFQDTHRRQDDGRFMVSLPFNGPEPNFIDSRDIAIRRFLTLEYRLEKNPELYTLYKDFMRDYLETGHMAISLPEPKSNKNISGYYIPHHAVVKPESSTTKLRVVFDASTQASVGGSLNDHLLIGPPLQKDITVLLLHFRTHPVVLTADIQQMYRQILVSSDHRKYQKIVWRFDRSDPIVDYELNTVTYGVASSPFLALRVIQELAHLELSKFPSASKVLSSDTYVDDLVTGCQTIEEAKLLIKHLDNICRSGGFNLRKWNSNKMEVLEELPKSSCYQNPFVFNDSSNLSQKILGLQWQPLEDNFSYSIHPISRPATKRNMVSEIARIFDPLGLLTPLSFFAKHLIQLVWILGLDWDDNPPLNISSKWKDYLEQLSYLSELKIPRWILSENHKSIQLHAFCDASEKGYAAVIYFRVVDIYGQIMTHLVCAKSKVAPTNRVSVPRLELCAAVLLSNLVEFVQNTYKDRLSFAGIFAWSDSTVSLSWIRSSSYNWKTFISNRISHIQERVSPSFWYHIGSNDNPADCASRGLLARDLIEHVLWWKGPPWLQLTEDNWPANFKAHSVPILSDTSQMESEKRTLSFNVTITNNFLDTLLNQFSNLSKICRIIVYVKHFIRNLQSSVDSRTGVLENVASHQEQDALHILVGRVQEEVFHLDIANIKNGKPISKSLRALSPFVDGHGLLRVGGRLRNSDLPYDTKFPLLLPRSHRLTELVILNCHRKNLHSGLRTTQFLVNQNFWILSAKKAVKHCLRTCIRCFRVNPVAYCPPMGDLPASRVTPGKAFLHTGVDYGGPFFITMNRKRGAKLLKAYICLFICFSTKAIHLELVSDLSTEAFIASLRRFIARRGKCLAIHSDCGSNFIGAAREIVKLMQQSSISEGIEFIFNPPSAPHFGGLWEAGIKSVKTYLKKVIGNQNLSFEEFNTVLVQVESILNSRPLCPLSSNPEDFTYLTPGHFLGLEPVSVIPDPDLAHVKYSHLTRWQLLQRIQQDFWKRWRNTYLHTLQQKHKWFASSPPIQIGSLVLIKMDNTPPLSWPIGRIESLYFGNDKVSRVAMVKTMHGTYKRPLVKLCPLPLDDTSH